MRQIKFKGKRISDGVWLYGDLMHLEKDFKPLIKIIDWSTKDQEVDPDTVSQFTGLTDKNGNEIYEGDRCIINFCFSFYNKIAIVYYKDARFYLDDKHPEGNLPLSAFVDSKRNSSIEIIGNIHDNPELLNPQ
ncbi:MAG: YopX family protein [Dysgonomonas sp.]|uniref:YopX family protein n=1 Tax=Dysgonomonas sp. TaxID=1891233 RepID=UPI0039E5C273